MTNSKGMRDQRILTENTSPSTYVIGWDVGGWNCENNPRSRDALFILAPELSVIGQPWRGNLRETINQAENTGAFVRKLFSLCGAAFPAEKPDVTLAIDTPLGFSTEFMNLASGLQPTGPVEKSNTNRYLYRQTERYLFQLGLTPLSPLKDMLGSQATKGMHVLARFAPQVERCGVWSGGEILTAIEAYPSACQGSKTIEKLRSSVQFSQAAHQDQHDALTCALVAWLFANRPMDLIPPAESVPASEGWIWFPQDIIRSGVTIRN